MRLADGASYLEGRVEICSNGEWGTICNEAWNSTETDVVCRQLGLVSAGKWILYQNRV